jgi:hypothetical protein
VSGPTDRHPPGNASDERTSSLQSRPRLQNISYEKSRVSQPANGQFDVKVTAQKPDSEVKQTASLTRMTIDKHSGFILDIHV